MNLIATPNTFVAHDPDALTQLSYSLQINPAPLTVSIPNKLKVLGSLEFVVTNRTGVALSVDSVDFTIEVGSLPSLTPSTDGIATSVSDKVNWIVVPPSSESDEGLATYTLLPATNAPGLLAPGASVVVQIFQIETNAVPGNSTIKVKEIVGSLPGFTSFQVTTFPSGFYFNSLAAMVDSGSGLMPVAQVAAQQKITLTWNSSVVDTHAFEIYYSDASQGQKSDTTEILGKWTSHELTSDTVFTVMVTASVEGGQPLTASLSTAVSVQNPSLIADSVNTNQATVNGNASIAVLKANTINGTSVSLTGSGSSVSLNADGTINASGQASLGSAKITGSANITGTLSVGDETKLGSVTAQSVSAGSLKVASGVEVDGGNIEIPVGQNFGTALLSSNFTYNGFTTGAYAIGWFKDPWEPTAGPTAWLTGYGGIKIITGGGMPTKPGGATTPAFTIDFNGNITHSGKLANFSSAINTENVRALTADEAFDILNHLDPVHYTRKASSDGRTCLGFIAEHVHSSVASPDGQAVIPDEILTVLTRVVKEQQQVIQKLEEKVNALEGKKL